MTREPETLLEVLERIEEASGTGITFVGEKEREVRLAYPELLELVRTAGAALEASTAPPPGARLAVISPDCLVQAALYLGAVSRGHAACLLPSPSLLIPREHYRRILPAMLETLAPFRLLTDEATAGKLRALLPQECFEKAPMVTWETLVLRPSPSPSPRPSPSDLCHIQFSSGTADRPKGVLLTHANVTANLGAMAERLETTGRDRGISWLPLHHDMGLVGGLLLPLWCRMEHVQMRPMTFLSRPRSWLERIVKTRATLAVAPGFAYELCAEKVRPGELEGDLTAVRGMLNGSEPIRAAGVLGFLEAFAGRGLSPDVMLPCYGLAEASLAVTICPARRPLRVDRVDRDALEREGRREEAEPGDTRALSFVSVGPPLRDTRALILNDRLDDAGEDRVGEIAVAGPAVMAGYLGEGAPSPFHTGPKGERWLLTGDLGYLHGGELYVTGRCKDLIVLRGRNLDPADLEEAADAVPGVRAGHTIAFSHLDPATGRETLVLLAETTREGGPPEELKTEIAARIGEAIGVTPDVVSLVPRGWIERTTSGKKMRYHGKMRYLSEQEDGR